MWIADFDQYPFGHQRPKPTSLLTNSWTLYTTLQNVRCSPEELQCLKQRPLPELGQRMEQSRAWGKWAPGLCRAIGEACTAWVLSKREQRESEAQEDQAMLAKLSSEEESFIQHCEQDHVCFRPDCRVCLSGAIRSHQHARSKYPQRNALTLTADLIGPLVPAEDQAHKQVKHLLIAALTVPAYEGGTLKQLAEGKDVEDALIPEAFELDQDGAQSGGADADPTEFAFEDQGETVGEEDSGVEESEGPKTPQPSINSNPSKESERREARWKEELKTLRKPVKVKHLVFAVPVPTKRASAILKAIQYIYCRIRQLGLSVRRLHTDNGREFSNQLLDGWCETRDIYHTTSVPSDPRSNGLAEAFVNLAKCGIRTLLDSAKAPKTDWPHAARHWAEARLQKVLRELGSPPRRPLVPFGIPVIIKKSRKTPHDSKVHTGKAVGPSARTPGSTVIRLTNEDGSQRLYTAPVVYERVKEPIRFVGQEVAMAPPVHRVHRKTNPAEVVSDVRNLTVVPRDKGESEAFICRVCDSQVEASDERCRGCGLIPSGFHVGQPKGSKTEAETKEENSGDELELTAYGERLAEELLRRPGILRREDVDKPREPKSL